MSVSGFFDEEKDKGTTNFIPPDYSAETQHPDEDDDDEDDDDDDFDILEEDDDDEEEIESILQEQSKQNEKEMNATPFGSPITNPATPSWGTGIGGGQQTQTNWWTQPKDPSPGWGTRPGMNSWGGVGAGGNTWGQTGTGTQGAKTQMDRTKKVIFIDFLDAIVETYQSGGNPGLLPRDIYDLKPRFDVWTKLSAFSPERVYMILPLNVLNNSTGTDVGITALISYFSISLSAFLRIPAGRCQVVCQSYHGQRKEDLISSVLKPGMEPDSVLIGIRSGMYAQNNGDQMAAERCGIDYYDLTQLLNNMY